MWASNHVKQSARPVPELPALPHIDQNATCLVRSCRFTTRVSPKVCLGARLGRRRRIWPGFSLASTVLFCGHSSLALLPVAVRCCCCLLLAIAIFWYLLLSAALLSVAVWWCYCLLTGATVCRLVLLSADWCSCLLTGVTVC